MLKKITLTGEQKKVLFLPQTNPIQIKGVAGSGKTKKEKTFLFTTYSHNQIRIYGKESFYSFQILLKVKGEKWFEFKDLIKAKKGKNLEQVKELGFIVLKGLLADTKKEKDLLRNIYSRIC